MENRKNLMGYVNLLQGRLESILMWLVYPLVAVMVAEIVARYFFLRPLPWVRDVSIWLFAVPFMLTVAHYYNKKAHISAEDLVHVFRLNAPQLAIIDLLHHIIILSVAGFLFWPSLQATIRSFSLQELSGMTTWRPILWPFRAVIPMTMLLLGLQGLSGILEAVKRLQGSDKQ
ncbi:MAG: hypothetical protein DDT34_01858 [Firmicutes bacterium]|nr:hypothetical protein [Bacillota bacterium]MBT9158657.1 hypothetical protein [Bacillota bacterium]